LINETYLNHGDLSFGNILKQKNNFYILDFDETLVGPKLYDFAVVCIKFFMRKNKINQRQFNKLKYKIKQHIKDYVEKDFKEIIIYYLCKILIEKFALHIEGKIDLFSLRQMQDNYKKYLNLLKTL
jgi:thiamine kinase-like enzyme